MAKKIKTDELVWHENLGARILLSSHLIVQCPFPELIASTKNKKRYTSVTCTITSHQDFREAWELMLDHPPNNFEDQVAYEIIRHGETTFPFRGREMVVQRHIFQSPNPDSFILHYLFYLDDERKIVANIQIFGPGLINDAAPTWQKVIDSFSWNKETGVAFKYDGDEQSFRKQYAKPKRKRKIKPIRSFPTEIEYLRPVVEEILSLPLEEVNESHDTSELEQLLTKRVFGLTQEEKKMRLYADIDALDQWIREDDEKRGSATFVSAFIDGFYAFNDPEVQRILNLNSDS